MSISRITLLVAVAFVFMAGINTYILIDIFDPSPPNPQIPQFNFEKATGTLAAAASLPRIEFGSKKTAEAIEPPLLHLISGETWQRATLPIRLRAITRQLPDREILMPVEGTQVANVLNTWGAPRHGGRRHEGQDIFAPRGTPIRSGTEGYIISVGRRSLGGNYVMVMGAGGRIYYYAHLDGFARGIAAGDYVTTDTIIGYVGATGNAAGTPPHLHFGIYEGRRPINPLPLLVDRTYH